MCQVGPMPLYMAASVGELNSLAEVNVSFRNPKLISNSAKKVYSEAEKFSEKGDEERGYVLYMKYLSLFKEMQDAEEYKAEKKFFDRLLGVKNIKRAIKMAEVLQRSLAKRYELQQEEMEAKQMLETREKEKAEERRKKKEEKNNKDEDILKPEKVGTSTLVNGVAEKGIKDDCITSVQLYNLIQKQSTSFLLMDVRSSSDFRESHIKHGACISVPEENVKPGITAVSLGKLLPSDSRDLWPKRSTVDHIIVLDWASTSFSQESTVKVLKDILMKWDPGNVYKSDMLLLNGGYEDWLMTYPMMTTNPTVHIPLKKNTVDLNSLLDFEYPDLEDSDLDDAFIATPSPPSTKNKINNDGIISTGTKRLTSAADIVSKKYQSNSRPVVDRSVKPKEFTEKKNIPPRSEVQNFVEARTVLPSSDLISSVISNNEESDCLLQPSSDKSRKQDLYSMDNVLIKPSVDRTLKAKALLRYEERPKEIDDILKAEEEIVDDSLTVERKRLEFERQWEMIRLKKEMEAEEELRGELQKREAQLIKILEEIEKEKQQKDKENELLRSKLAEILRKEEKDRRKETLEDQEKGSQGQGIKDRIKQKDKEKKDLEEKVEKLRKQRKEKEKKEAERKLQDEELKKKEARLVQEELERKRKIEEQERMKEQEELERLKKEEKSLQEEKKNKQIEKEKGSYFTKLKDVMDSPVFSPSTSSGLWRSHSSPNIAQMLDEEDSSVKSRVPQFDRSIKPLYNPQPQDIHAARQRNFMPVYGNVSRGTTGLKNLGNTCYMNSVLQCISNIKLLADFFIKGEYRDQINRRTKTSGQCAEEVAFVVRSLWCGQYRSFGCRDLKTVVGKYYKPFSSHEQQDSHEFLTYLMDWLHEDLNRVPKRPLKEQNNDNIEDHIAAKQAWDDFKNSNQSIISSLFYGQRKSTVTCLTCSKTSTTFEPFFNLSIPIPPGVSRCSLKDCIQLYLKDEKISGWKCPKCKTGMNAAKKIDLWKMPSVLILHLQRFYNDELWRKRQTYVDFPLNDLELAPYIPFGSPQKTAEHTTFYLNAISNHYGTMEGGHYTAYCKSSVYDSWYKYDDHEVYEIDDCDVKSSAAYILLYSSVRNINHAVR